MKNILIYFKSQIYSASFLSGLDILLSYSVFNQKIIVILDKNSLDLIYKTDIKNQVKDNRIKQILAFKEYDIKNCFYLEQLENKQKFLLDTFKKITKNQQDIFEKQADIILTF